LLDVGFHYQSIFKEEPVKKVFILIVLFSFFSVLISSCDMLSGSDPNLDNTRVALAIQQTGLAIDQTNAAQAEAPTTTPEPTLQPTYTPYPTFTSQADQAPAEDEPEDTEPELSFDDWMDDAEILLYDDMLGSGQSPIIESAIDGLGLGSNTKNVGDAMGDLLTNLNSSTQWDLIIVAAESRSAISGEYFDVLIDQIDRGSAMILEIWYIDDIAQGRIQPVMQRCGISFQRDWWRDNKADLNDYLVYLLEPDDPMFSQPNAMSMLIPSGSFLWVGDIGDLLEINAGSDAVLLGGAQKKQYDSYGAIAECLDGRMVWQTFSTHDYKYQDMINMWQNYIYNTLLARYEYLQE
jgi:hypothetical protein